MTVGNLRKLLEGILEDLENFDDNKEIKLQGNTYFTRNNSFVLQTPKGFIGLDNIEDAINEDNNEDAEGE